MQRLVIRRIATSSFQFGDDPPQLNDLQGALGPVMLPADDDVASCGVVAMIAEVTAPVFELDSNVLPALLTLVDATLGFTVWIGRVNRLDDKAQLITDHPEEEDHTLFVDGRMPKATEVDRRAERGTVESLPLRPGGQGRVIGPDLRWWWHLVARLRIELGQERRTRFILLVSSSHAR